MAEADLAIDDGERTLESALWHVFIEYNLRSNPLDALHMSLSTFRRLCRDFVLLKGPAANAEFELAYRAETGKAPHKTKPSSSMSFNNFCEAIARLSTKRFARLTKSEALERLILTCFIPKLDLVQPVPMLPSESIDSAKVLKAEILPCLRELLTHYLILPPRANIAPSGLATFEGFMRFVNDFQVTKYGLLSAYICGKVFASLLSPPKEDEVEFIGVEMESIWTALVNLATLAYLHADCSLENKVKGLLVHMSRVVQRTTSEVESAFQGVSSLSCVYPFKSRVASMWQSDGYRDYLESPKGSSPRARDLLRTARSPDSLRRSSTHPAIVESSGT